MDCAVIVLVVALAAPVVAQTVVDGDMIDVSGTRYRIWGFDAGRDESDMRGWLARAGGIESDARVAARPYGHCEA